MAEKEVLNPNEVKLSDGRVVVMKEITGLDEIVATQMLGDKLTNDLSGQMLLQKALTLKSIVSIDGKPFSQSGLKFKDMRDFYAGISSKDDKRLAAKCIELNIELPGAKEDSPFEQE